MTGAPQSTTAPPPSTAASAPVLAIRALRFGYEPGEAVVEGISAALHAGQIAALIGPNAAGKSTLLRLLLGHAEPWAGAVELAGQNVAHLSAAARAASISFVPQRGSTGFAFTVGQVVAMGRHALPPDPAAVSEAIAACDLSSLTHRIYAQLSVGQQQRVLLARALAQSAGGGRVMLLDEPVSAMDLWHIHQTMRLLVARSRRSLAILVVLHDLNLAARYADVVWLMDRGRMTAAGPWGQVLRPEILEPVYSVRLRPLHPDGDGGRPVFLVDPPPPVV
jgi:iron complex transport system ATP-binding protein